MSKVLKGAGVLAVCALIAKMIGALYRIPLTNIVGAEGIGLYQMVFPLYTVLLTISSGGLPVAISKVVAGKMAKNDRRGARQVLKVSLLTLTLAGIAAAGFVVLLRNKIAFVQGNERAALPYLGIAPSIVFVAVISCFRGYYQGVQNMLPSAISQLIEQVVKLFAGLTLARIMLKYSLEHAVLGALIGVSLSELVAMLALLVQFFFTNLKYKKQHKISFQRLAAEAASDNALALPVPREVRTRGEVLKEIYKVAIPVTLGSLVLPMTQVIDSILVINLLVNAGFMQAEATSLFGLVTGPINSLINMPIVITLSMSVALLPKVSECFIKNENPAKEVGEGFKYNFIIALLMTLLFAVFARPILSVLYSKGLSPQQITTGGTLLMLGSVSILYVSILQVATSVLQGANMAHKPALNLLYGAILKVIFTLILLPIFGITGAMAGTVLCYGITCLLDVISMRKICRPVFKFREFLLAPLLAGVAFALCGIFSKGLFELFTPPRIALVLSIAAACVFYILFLFLFGAIKLSALGEVPLLGKLFKRKKKPLPPLD